MLGAWQLARRGDRPGVLATLPLRYPFGTPRAATVMALMSDPAASPVRGQAVRLDGKAIGRVSPASSPERTSSTRTRPG